MVPLEHPCTQERFGWLVGISQQAVSELVGEGVLVDGQTAHAWLLAYTSRLREQAAGRATSGDLDLATERARLASEQADAVAMKNQERRRELAPVGLLEASLAGLSRQIAAQLDAIPVNLKRRTNNLTREDLAFVESEIKAARNLAADIRLDWGAVVDDAAFPTFPDGPHGSEEGTPA